MSDTNTMFVPLSREELDTAAAPVTAANGPTDGEKVNTSRQLWEGAGSHELLDHYLCEARGIPKPADGWPASVRLHPGMPYSFHVGRQLPAMLLTKTDAAGEIVGLHAVFLSSAGQKADVPTPKKSYGRGGVVVLRAQGETLIACEGPEDAITLAVTAPKATVICTAGAGTLHRVADHLVSTIKRVILVADRDEVGRKSVERAAAALTEAGMPVLIATPPEGCKDANDVVRLDCVDAVRAMLNTAVRWEPASTPGEEETDSAVMASSTAKATDQTEANGFVMRKTGLFFSEPDPEKEDTLLSGPFEVVAEARDVVGVGWSVVLVWKDHDGREHEWAMPRAMLAGDGADYRRALLDGGLYVAPGRKARELLTTYLATVRVQARATCVDRTGWHGRVYVASGRSFGDTRGERVLLQGFGTATEVKPRGTFEGWRAEVAALAVGNSRLAFSLSAAFAGPLLYLLNAESGGVHFRGASSIGKSSALYAAASAWGCPVHNWRATDNASEALARAANDALLCLDELGQADGRAADAMGYMLSNGTGKARMSKDTTARPVTTWRVLFLSSGEIGLAEKVAETGRRAKAGQEVRILEVPADAGAGLGAFEDLHGSKDGDSFARRLRMATEMHRGHAAYAFLERVTAGDLDALAEAVRAACERWRINHLPHGADGQVQRAAGRFALIAAAGELATVMGILPWPKGEATRAAAACFQAWIEARGGKGPAEVTQGIAQVRAFLEAHGMSRFQAIWSDNEAETRPVPGRVGFRRKDDEGRWEFFAMVEGFKEMCKGFNAKALAVELVKAGMLEAAGDGKSQKNVKVPGHGQMKLYHFPAFALEGDGHA
ncbi:DUF927 domain-containing protein [Azospirillum sp. Vi22]|uniref:DUF927 domain-containing protein n=1 Tax=Azospirillum baldaniorum TaxID=1064539 RepID=UPI00157A3FA0|nr:DUF927 domain-containing protein [Azospirillum baldaniorum]NUB09722.1 DUF927 domain-containing protein [Azospirillum baldaniorum]